ncbi:MAG TPA: hypothetical protein VMV26_03205 [Alphaproteobacteria bacterium]|nr:hypothetical protein [Alphaproteobacteria bacterium]
MIVGRALGLLLCGVAFAFLVRDFVVLAVTGSYTPIITGQMWHELSPGSLNLAQAVTQRYLFPWVWDPVIRTWLLWPVWISFGLLGLILVIIFRRWSRAAAD